MEIISQLSTVKNVLINFNDQLPLTDLPKKILLAAAIAICALAVAYAALLLYRHIKGKIDEKETLTPSDASVSKVASIVVTVPEATKDTSAATPKSEASTSPSPEPETKDTTSSVKVTDEKVPSDPPTPTEEADIKKANKLVEEAKKLPLWKAKATDLFDEASKLYEKVLSSHPTNFNALLRSGDLYFAMDENKMAAAQYLAATKIQADAFPAWKGYADSLDRLDHHYFEETAAAFEKCFQLKPDDLEIKVSLANALRQLCNYEMLGSHVDQFSVKEKNFATGFNPWNTVFFKEDPIYLAKRGRSLLLFQDLLKAKPDDLYIHSRYAEAILSISPKIAVEHAKLVLESKPLDTFTIRCYGNALYMLGQFEEAKQKYKQVLSYGEYDLNALCALAYLLELQDQLDEAQVEAEKLLTLDPEHSAGKRLMQKIALKKAAEASKS